MAERTLPTLDLSGASSQVTDKWKKWKQAFKYYVEGQGLDNTGRKTSRLLHYVGMEVQGIFEDLVDPNPAGDQGPYAVSIRKLHHHLCSEENIPFERDVYRQLAKRKRRLSTR